MVERALAFESLCGIFAPIIAFICIFSAVASWSAFSWTNNALSDLGVQAGVTAPIFNSGLVLTGLLSIVFSFGLLHLLDNRLSGKIGVAVFATACVALVCIGIFNESFSPTHFLVSVAFFLLLPISMWILAGEFWIVGLHRMSVFTLAIAFAAVAPWVLQSIIHYVSGVAIPEFGSSVAAAVWAEVLSLKMLKIALGTKKSS